MSTNCIRCIKNKRTSLIDLLCDSCRAEWERTVLLQACNEALQHITGTGLEHTVINHPDTKPLTLGEYLRKVIEATEAK
jgi:hypothetical protein